MEALLRLIVPKELAADLLDQEILGLTFKRTEATTRDLQSGIADGTVLSVLGDASLSFAMGLLANAVWAWLGRANKQQVELTVQHSGGDTRISLRCLGPAGRTPTTIRVDISA